ncbi:MAG: alkaline phosphatase family protein [Thiotrichales bacterium]|nr:alkaline phosphatase family protein [Thiotrichales bacterium]
MGGGTRTSVERRVVHVVVDGLRGDHVDEALTPNLHRLATTARWYPHHRSVFPSATRVNSASLATGCFPASHGLHGNVIALDEGSGLVPVPVGPPTFRERLRRATGRTLRRPTLSERLRDHGGAAGWLNSSAGAAHMQDPDGHGLLLHRNGSHRPGFAPVEGPEHLDVTYDATGDRETTRRFCAALDAPGGYALHTLWLCEPDHSQHVMELGSPEHRALVSAADANVADVVVTVGRMRDRGEEVLLVVCSDHGHETTDGVIPVEHLMIEAGLKADTESTEVVFASSGMGALVYLAESASSRRDDIVDWLERQPWCGPVFAGDALADVEHREDGGLAIAFSMAKVDAPNRFGVPGISHVAGCRFSSIDGPGRGQHGGLGRYETNAMLIIDDGSGKAHRIEAPTRAVDVAPTILDFLGVAWDGADGRPVPTR